MNVLAEHRVRSTSTECPQLWLSILKKALLALFAVHSVTAKNPRDNFCRRFAHQTTVIDDKLYIDGGWVNFDGFAQDHLNSSNTWLAYHDLNKTVNRGGELWPDLNISLNKNDSIPTVHGGVLWGDDVNKRFYLYGGEWNLGYSQEPYHILSYDILYDKWDDFGTPNLKPPPNIASYGAGVGVSQTGMGYYYGGWISNASMSGWTQPRKMSSSFYTYAYDTNTFTQAAVPDKSPRAEGAMVWIPVGDYLGIIVYMGGMVMPYGNDTVAPQPLDEIFVFDAAGNSWSKQKATGQIPQNRRQFCIDVAWAPDKSSFNIYLWGGLSMPPPVVNTTSFADVYILTLPSFTWVKVYPDHHGNATLPPEYGHYSSSCNMIKSMSQFYVIGGTYSDTDACDLAYIPWAQHNLWTGTLNNAGDNDTYWALYNPNVTSNVVPIDVYSVVGGNKEGGATLKSPKDGFDVGNRPLMDQLGKRPSFPQRTPTREITVPTPTPSKTDTPQDPSDPALSTGAIVGIAIGSVVGLTLVAFVCFSIRRKIVRRREARRQSQVTQVSYSGYSGYSGSTAGAMSTILSRHASMGRWTMRSGPESPPPPCELPTQPDRDMAVISELPQDRMYHGEREYEGMDTKEDAVHPDGVPSP
ncbi:hypothetical protein DM02DRAFT_694321 [Periconia macrospinosa]|uniref:Kelch repeat protein n=1 Tax=Periconia macrospinosa TaxID=97972 RepID=A0A2V1D7F2_9PLEO|nr:hypothetical protein DM02DRAFT_694321 [Periconia macrospinosa]